MYSPHHGAGRSKEAVTKKILEIRCDANRNPSAKNQNL
jgi:hypothetical protein